jgi:hypothetical protein
MARPRRADGLGMKLRKLADGSLEISERWTLLRFGCGFGGAAIPLAVAWSHWGEDPVALGAWVGAAGGAALLSAIAAIVSDRRTAFDAVSRTVRWQERSWLRMRGGEIPFEDVEDVVVTAQRTREHEHRVGGFTVHYSVALLTAAGPLPLTATHGTSRSEYDAVAEAILAVLSRLAKPAEPRDEVRQLVAVGGMVDAVARIRAERGVGLTEARAIAAEIARECAPDHRRSEPR